MLGRLMLSGLLMLLVGLFGALGVWQLERRAWKRELINRVESRIHAPVQKAPPLPQWPALTRENAEYRPVLVSGQFLHEKETLTLAVTGQGRGAWVLTPLQTGQGFTVLVNRGFVPDEKRNRATRQPGQISGTVTVRGLLRMSEPGGGFLRHNNPGQNRWYSRDVAAIAQARGLDETAPYFVDADATPNPGGFPVGGQTVVTFRNSHLTYACTWFALAAMSFGMLGVLWGYGRKDA